ncbi:DUF4870 domain-containing protein [Belliella filtrata]|uniref:DUF4870 domain-containing protein n=1 Tax=Belliella filtrata TaxID=2923435 RepID=UPI00374DC9CE
MLIWICKRDEVKDIRKHAIDVINFQLSISLDMFPFVIFISPLILLALFSQVVISINAMKVTSHQDYKYLLSIRFLKQE